MDQKLYSIRIARAGTFTSNEGVKVTFGEADFRASAAAYKADADPAPLVIGHPALDDPAYGWVSGLRAEGGALFADADRVEPAFAEQVEAGRYAKVSARFYPPEHPANPSPGVWYLKHVGFLGAHAPGIKGLGTVQFADGDEGAVTIDLSNKQERTMSDAEMASFAEREAALNSREQQITDREAVAAKAAADARHAEHVSFAEGLGKDGKVGLAGQGLIVGLLDHFDSAAMVSFGEAGEMAPAAAFKNLLEGAQPLVDLGERGKKPDGEKSYTSFAAPDGYEVDPDLADLHARATAIQQENPSLDWMACVRRAQAA